MGRDMNIRTLLPVLVLTTFVLLGCSTTPDVPAPVATPDIEATVEATVVAKVEVEPTPGSPATPHVEPTVTPVAASSEGNRLVISFSPETEARYRVKEQLAKLNLPNDAVGVTDWVIGMVTFDVDGKVIPGKSKITINASTLTSDEDRRDNRIRKDILQTNRFPTVDFVIKKTPGLTWPLPGSGDGLFELVGDLTIRDVTKEITWNVSAIFTPNQIQGLAETSFTFGNFELDRPSGMAILSVEDLIRLELDFVVTYP
jgi:polyisoprenoid-binding protein YceI